MAALCRYLQEAIYRVEYVCINAFFRQFPPGNPCLALAANEPSPIRTTCKPFSLKDLIGDGFLWAVPKKRRSILKRWMRRFGHDKYHWKMLVAKKNILICNKCGGYREAGVLCPTCYHKINEETSLMQETIQKELKLDPVDKEVVVLYKGEQLDKTSEFWKGKRIVEMQKERPSWFSKNLMEPTTQAPATTADVKPTDLA